ncbi:MAG: NADH-quinone oxidoreductase subunit M [Planctomycetes bacterium]|nr:NADH-quinone oxidoreductase subunit M [Planctomycetota bacterium]
MLEFVDAHILTILILFPVVGAILVALVSSEDRDLLLKGTLGLTLAEFLISLHCVYRFDEGTAAVQFGERYRWIPEWGVTYCVGIDGISLWLVLLTTFLTPLVILSAWHAVEKRLKAYLLCFLLLESTMIGALVALDFVLFYLFWEAMLLPMFLLIGVWGGQRRIYAAVKFMLFTMVGSVLMLVAVLWLYFEHAKVHAPSTNLLDLYGMSIPFQAQCWLFGAFALAFAIKVPMFPLHTWLPDAHVEAPTGGSVILAAVLLKMGTYGFMRFAIPLFPEAAEYFAPALCALAVIGIVYGALVSFVQPDLKKMVAYSSVSHLGYVMLGLFAFGLCGAQGGLMQMLSHGLTTGALFLCVGMLYERRHTRLIEDYGGIATVMPHFAILFVIITLGSIGLPGLSGFVAEFLVLVGAFGMEDRRFAIIAGTGVILGAMYMLSMVQRVLYGPTANPKNQVLKDLSGREIAVLAPILVFILWMGIQPGTFLDRSAASIDHWVTERSDYRLEFRPVRTARGEADGEAAAGAEFCFTPLPLGENRVRVGEEGRQVALPPGPSPDGEGRRAGHDAH